MRTITEHENIASVPAPFDRPVDGLAGFRHRYADVNNTRIHFVVGGDGPAIVLLHGWPYTWAECAECSPLSPQLATR